MQRPSPHPRAVGWFEEFHDRLLRFLTSRVYAESDAQDLAQEVFLRVLRIPDPDLVEHPRAYLYRIAANVVDDWRGARGRMEVRPPEAFEAAVDDSEAADELIESERARAVDGALRRLPPTYRAVLVLHTQHGLSCKAIAGHLGITERMVKRYVVKGYARMRDELAGMQRPVCK